MIVVEELEDLYDDEELEHSGIKGMRWGIRRFQNSDGSLTPAGRKRYMKDAKWRSKYEKAVAAEKAKTEARNAKTAAKEEKAQESAEQRHQRIMKSSDAKELYKNRSELSTEEINERINRIQAEQRLASYIQKEPTKLERAMEKVDSAMGYANKVAKWADTPAGKLAVKGIKKQLGIEDKAKGVDYESFIKGISGKSDKEIADMANRVKNENVIRSMSGKWKEGSSESSTNGSNASSNRESSYQRGNDFMENPFYGSNESGKYKNGKAKFKRRNGVQDEGTPLRDWEGSSRNESQSNRAERVRATVVDDGSSRTNSEHRSSRTSDPIDVSWEPINSDRTSEAANYGLSAVDFLLGSDENTRRRLLG